MSGHASSPLPPWLASLPAAIHRWVVDRRNRSFDRGRGVVTLDRPVLAVGNLSVGGTGKTPLSLLILRWLMEAGARPAVAMRGYGNPSGRDSDEAQLYLRAWPQLPLVAQPDRLVGLLKLFATIDEGDVGCVLLDDGFQHRRIARQADIVVVDATRPPHADRMLPAGWLREPITSIARATAVVITHCADAGDPMVARTREALVAAGAPPLFALCDHHWGDVVVTGPGGERALPVEWLAGRRVAATCALGNPAPFLAQLRAAGADVRAQLILPDHDPFAPGTVERLIETARREGVQAVVCTEKDWSKLARVAPRAWPCEVARPRLALRFREGEDQLRAHVLEVASRTID